MEAVAIRVINLRDLLDELSVERVQEILSTFSCPLNTDIEGFLTRNAIDFSNQGKAQTHLVIGDVKGTPEILGYYALANKILTVSSLGVPKSMAKRIGRFGTFDEAAKAWFIPAPLIAQLGKNYSHGVNECFDGAKLLKIACSKVSKIQREFSGKLVYIECEKEPKLISFYERNGFRITEKARQLKTNELIQMIRYL